MPRQKRLLGESKFYHVMIRGNEKKDIFHDNTDRYYFLKLLFNQSNVVLIYAYCLMRNHVHLLLYDPYDLLSKVMQSLNISYAMYYNEKYNRTGHFLQDRFKSEIIINERQLMAAVRYIHNNPVKANICSCPSEYKWSSFRYYIQKNDHTKNPLSTGLLLEMFSLEREKAIELFFNFSRQHDDERFIDLDEKPIASEQAAKDHLEHFMEKNRIRKEDLKSAKYLHLRTELVKKLKQHSTLSVRKIAKLLDLDRNIVQRIK